MNENLNRVLMIVGMMLALALLPGCSSKSTPAPTPAVIPAGSFFPLGSPQPGVLALVGGVLIDGTGADPLPDAVLLVRDGWIVSVGSPDAVEIPSDAVVIDVAGATVLPGFINAHVHDGFDEANLRLWAQGGVTTVRDEGLRAGQGLAAQVSLRAGIMDDPKVARLVSAGAMITVPEGYGHLYVSSPAEARRAVFSELEQGADLLKVSLEDGYAGMHDLPKLTDEELAAITAAAHERGVPVSGHVTEAEYLHRMVEAGVDDIAHVPWDYVPPSDLRHMVERGITLVPTFTVFRNYGAPVEGCVDNLRRFVGMGGHVALGSDYAGGPGDFEPGIPMYEVRMMNQAGMTPMQIITAATLNAAVVSNLDGVLGTLAPGKIADVLVIDGDPLTDLYSLYNVLLVVHNGAVIRNEIP